MKEAQKNINVNGSNRREIVNSLLPYFGSRIETQLKVFDILDKKRVAFAGRRIEEGGSNIVHDLAKSFQAPGVAALSYRMVERVLVKARAKIKKTQC